MFKYIKSIFLVLLLIITGESVLAADCNLKKHEVIFRESTYQISAIDPTPASNIRGGAFPGLRGANQLIIYTPEFGLRTNTNEFGAEAIVDGDTVVSLSGADSLIPLSGLVISGHGKAKSWINKNITVGSKVYVDRENKTLTVYLTSESYLYEAKEKVKEAENIVNYYKLRNRDYNKEIPCFHINKALSYIKRAQRFPKYSEKYSELAIESANLALRYAIPFDKKELKGVWIRPTEKSNEEVANTLDKIKNAGINEVFLETYFHGMTIFPSKTMFEYGFYEQNPAFSFDVLDSFIKEAHKRDMKVNIWFESFYIGNKNPKSYPKNILTVKPEWANYNKANYDSKELVYSGSEHNGYFLDPANPQVQMFLETLITEIIECYAPDGINLDYVRYPQSLSSKFSGYANSNWGYTTYAREEFMTKYGKDPIEINYGDDLWLMWDKYRQDKISAFILRINEITQKRGVHLTTVIFPDRRKAMETKQQDWATWSLSNTLDGVTPLFLTCDPKTTAIMIKDILNNTSPSTKIYAGLFTTFMHGTQEDLLRQIHEARKAHIDGIIIFDYAHLEDEYISTLNTCVFNPQISTIKNQKSKKNKKKCIKKK
ncbi:MAG: hypothetical protein DKM22_00860 [Candidatus Melainabacteria bacterium]|nr:MAG: hypothetical protein DKM22_00860 [Candidatus Melainabacteria bacterium]